jgi:hypothetical protein
MEAVLVLPKPYVTAYTRIMYPFGGTIPSNSMVDCPFGTVATLRLSSSGRQPKQYQSGEEKRLVR